MKRIVYSLFLLLITAVSAHASETAMGVALDNFSTANPSKYFEVKLTESVYISETQKFPKNTVFYGRVIKVADGQVGKRQGYFEIHPIKYTTSEGEFDIKNNALVIKISNYQPLDKKEIAKKAATTGVTAVAGKVLKVPVLSQGVSFVKGVKNSEEGERKIVSGVKQVYEDSPLSYVEKGDSLKIYNGEKVKLHFSNED